MVIRIFTIVSKGSRENQFAPFSARDKRIDFQYFILLLGMHADTHKTFLESCGITLRIHSYFPAIFLFLSNEPKKDNKRRSNRS